jgi:hypothetical protein
MDYFDAVIETKILENNENLYTNMTKFLREASARLGQVGAMVTNHSNLLVNHSAFNVKKEKAS